jgi:hypothetical protein
LRFELTVNIHQAQITLEEGWLEIDLSGEEQEIEDAISWLKDAGLKVEPIE